MAEQQLMLSDEERQFLTALLQSVLKETKVEEHRTRTLSFREHVLHKEELLNEILGKIASSEGAPGT
jgi:hypothetical protein